MGYVPSYNRSEDNIILQAKIDQLEDMGVVAKARDINVIPRYASPCMLVKKNSIRELPKGEYEKMQVVDKLKYNRFVLCQDKLNNYIEKIPAKLNRLEDTLRIVGNHEFVITSDLTDSFWQRHVKKEKLPYFAFHSPFKGTYIFLRSCQGFLNQSEGLEEMVSCILEKFITEGWCRVHADNIYIMGDTMEETIQNWQKLLTVMLKNNLKLAPHKTFCFSKSMDLLGWVKTGRKLMPDPHRINTLIKAETPCTVKDLRSYLGSYRTFYKCKRNMSTILSQLEEFAANKPSSQKLEWTPSLLQEFEKAKQEASEMDDLYIPKSDDQLILTSDYSKAGINATLWAHVNGEFLVVSHMSAKLGKNNQNLLPCEGETLAHYVAAKCPNFSTPIRASNKKTISLLDNKTVCEASRLLKKGKFSSSKIINHLLVSISELNLDFQHLSGKMGQNFVDDYGSRNPIVCSKDTNSSCKVCNFIQDCSDLAIGALSFLISPFGNAIIGQVDVNQDSPALINDIIKGLKSIPLANRQAMRYLQERDPVLSRVKFLLLSGQAPSHKENKSVKRYFKSTLAITLAKDGCLITRRKNKSTFLERELIVVPEDISTGLVYSLHLNLNHPSPTQLSRIIQTRFFFLNRDSLVKAVWDQCALCQSIKHIPKDIHEFEPNQIPDHPGRAFTVDVIKYAKKNILIAVENFSSFISTCFIPTENSKDLIEGIIKTIFPVKSAWSSVRIDQAPGFRKLMKDKVSISELGMELNAGEAKNKNAVAIVDKKINELEKEIKKLSPSNNVITVKILALATNIVNEKVKNQGMSAKEILFSRDQITSENLHLQDDELANLIMAKRKENNPSSSKSKSSTNNPAIPANAKKGQLVFLKHDGSKFKRRDLYLVTDVNDMTGAVTICKIANALTDNPASFQPHNYVYKVRQTDIYLAPCQPVDIQPEVVVLEAPNYDRRVVNQQHYPANETNWYVNSKNKDSDNDIWIFEENPTNDEKHEMYTDTDSSATTPELDIMDNTITNSDTEQNDSQQRIFSDTEQDDSQQRIFSDTEQDDSQQRILEQLSREIGPNPSTNPTPGDMIEFLDTKSKPYSIIRAQVMPKRQAVQRRWPDHFIVQREDQVHPCSINLAQTRWRYSDNINQVDGNYTVDNISCLSSSIISPNENYDHNLGGDSFVDLHTSQSFFLDDELSDQESIFGYNYIENMTSTLSNSLAFEDQDDRTTSVPESTRRMLASLNLDIPRGGNLDPNRVYRLPPIQHDFRQFRSSSESGISQLLPHEQSTPAWYRRWINFKRFMSRVTFGSRK